MFDLAFRKRCEAIRSLAQRAWGSRFLGRQIDLSAAAGTEVTGYNDYTSGDDFRRVDWHRCSRHDELLTKQYRGREEQRVYLLVDASLGMAVHGGGKFRLAAELAAALGYLAIAGGDDAVLATSSGTGKPVRGKPKLHEWLRQVADLRPDKNSAGLRQAAEHILATRRKRGLTIVVSDFYDPAGYAPAIDLLRRNEYTPHLVQIFSPLEADPAWLGAVRLKDVATGRRWHERLDAEDLANYRQVFREFLAEIRGYCRRHSLGLLQTSSETPLEECVRRMVRVAVARAARGELASPLS